ncbi:MAG: diguanylate cyclase domain-containing protein [Candidatus Helarchaeota archaeon]
MMMNEKKKHSEKDPPLITDRYSPEELYAFIFKALMETDTDSIYIKDPMGRLNLVNRRMMNTLNIDDPSELIGMTDMQVFGEEFGLKTKNEEKRLYETGEPIASLVEVRKAAPNSNYWTHTTKIPLRNDKGEIFGLIGFTRVINQIKSKEKELRSLAIHDTLTNVHNRRGLFERLDEMIHQTTKKLAILEIDIDNLKGINDKYLHDAGDEFLKWFAWILKSTTRGNDIVSRIGGDEFVLILDNIKMADNVTQFCKKLYDNFNDSIDDRYKKLNVHMSVGISIYPDDSEDPNQLIKYADEALYYVKKHSKGRIQFYHSLPIN